MSPRIFDELINELRSFAQERDWEQFHTPKNLFMAVAADRPDTKQIAEPSRPDRRKGDWSAPRILWSPRCWHLLPPGMTMAA